MRKLHLLWLLVLLLPMVVADCSDWDNEDDCFMMSMGDCEWFSYPGVCVDACWIYSNQTSCESGHPWCMWYDFEEGDC